MTDENEQTDAMSIEMPGVALANAPAAAALQAQQVAMVQVRTMMAIQRPRDINKVRVRVLKECARPNFADAAIYAKPMGGKSIEGPSIRFAEALLRMMGNILVEVLVVSEDDEKRVLRVMATDLESNSTDYQEVVVPKVVERKNPKGRDVLRARHNSQGEPTYLVRATEDEMLSATNSAASKQRRNRIVAMVPADLVEEAIAACNTTLRDRDAKDPDAARKQLIDAFVVLGVQPDELRAYVDHDLDRFQPAELTQLRKVYNALRQGETTWKEVMETKRPPESGDKGKPQAGKAERLEKELTGKEPANG